MKKFLLSITKAFPTKFTFNAQCGWMYKEANMYDEIIEESIPMELAQNPYYQK